MHVFLFSVQCRKAFNVVSVGLDANTTGKGISYLEFMLLEV